MRLIMELDRRLRSLARERRGQNTVEYMLMLAVIVGVVLAVGALMKKTMPGIFSSISSMISGAAGSMGSASGG